MPGFVPPSTYVRGCAERLREIISTRMSKTAFREMLDQQNIGVTRYTDIVTLKDVV